jgi:hypothetical protein
MKVYEGMLRYFRVQNRKTIGSWQANTREKKVIWKQKLEIINEVMSWMLECKLFRLDSFLSSQELIFEPLQYANSANRMK